jgi:hypothetical protein
MPTARCRSSKATTCPEPAIILDTVFTLPPHSWRVAKQQQGSTPKDFLPPGGPVTTGFVRVTRSSRPAEDDAATANG